MSEEGNSIGFEFAAVPAEGIGPDATQQPAQDLNALLGGDPPVQNAAAQEPASIPPTPVTAPIEQMGAGESTPPTVIPGQDGQPAQPTHTFKVNGEEVSKTVDQLIDGYQLKSDYTREMQQIAIDRQQLGQQVNGVVQQREQYKTLLETEKRMIEQVTPPNEPNWAELATQQTPEQYQSTRNAWDQLQTRSKDVEKEQQRIAGEEQQEAQTNYGNYLAQQQGLLMQQMPDLAKPGEYQKFFGNVSQYLVNEYGFAPQEASMVNSASHLSIINKAMMWDRLQAGTQGKQVPGAGNQVLGPGIQPQVPQMRQTPQIPTLPAGAQQQAPSTVQKNTRVAENRFARTGSVEDAGGLLLAKMGG